MAEGYAFSHDPQLCIKCFTCEIACKEWHETPPGGVRLRRVYEVASGTFPDVTRTFHSTACQHCADPPCAGACAPGAISRDGSLGLVNVDTAKCDGCGKCLEACPFGAPQFDQTGVMRLCDLCSDRLARGKQPLCTDVCPTQALRYHRGQ